jgi:tetratricopeptide (TPR) repeat protein
MSNDQIMFEEAKEAARHGELTRARDLFTRLLRTDQNNTEYWLWMSAVVDSRQEQAYCLQNLLRLEPDHLAGRRGLILLGEAASDNVTPVPPERSTDWRVADIEMDRVTGIRAMFANPIFRIVFFGGLSIFVVAGLLFGFFGFQELIPEPPTPDFEATAGAFEFITLTPSLTPSITPSPEVRTPTPTPAELTPLAAFLNATYTPTPRYFNTPHPDAEAFSISLRAMQRQDWDEALEFMEQTREINPDAPDVHYYLGEIYFELGDHTAAMAAYNQAIQLDSLFAPAYVGRANVRLALDPGVDVSSDFRSAISADPNYPLIYLERAAYWILREDYTQALADLDTAEALAPESSLIPLYRAQIAFAQDDLINALAFAKEALDRDFTSLPSYRILAFVQFASGNYEEVLEPLETYTRYRRSDQAAVILLGDTYSQLDRLEDAIWLYDRILLEDDTQADVIYHRGLAYLRAGDAQVALDDFNSANRLRRNVFEYNLGIGRALIAIDSAGSAYTYFNEIAFLAETNAQKAELYYYRGLSLEAIDEPNLELNQWRQLFTLPEDDVPAAIWAHAQDRILVLDPPTPTTTPTPTQTATTTLSPTPEDTASPTASSTATDEPSPSATPTSTSTPSPSPTTTAQP